MNNEEKQHARQIIQFITGKWIAYPIYVVTKLEIPRILSQGPKSIDEISRICKAHGPFLYRVMKALTAAGIFHELENKTFTTTPMADLLEHDKMGPMVLMFLSEWHNRAWEKLYHGVKTGEVPFESAYGEPAFQWFKNQKEASRIFSQANGAKAVSLNKAILSAYDFSPYNSVMDIGGGYGGLLFKILDAHKHLHGTLGDLSYIIKDLQGKISQSKLNSRCEAVSCDFFSSIPEGKDIYILMNILHDWDDEKSSTILQNCRNSMTDESLLLIIESIVPEGNEFSVAKLLDIEVMVMGGGKERTELEYRKLIRESGLVLKNILETDESVSILECKKNSRISR